MFFFCFPYLHINDEIKVLVIPTNEEAVIADETFGLVKTAGRYA